VLRYRQCGIVMGCYREFWKLTLIRSSLSLLPV